MVRSKWLSSLRHGFLKANYHRMGVQPRGIRRREILASEVLVIEPRSLLSAAIVDVAPEPAEIDLPPIASGVPTTSPFDVVAPANNDATWTPVGPFPIENGQVEGIASQNNPVSGAVHVVLPHPTDANILWVGTTNGGVWKTTNARSSSPTWTPQIDQESSLSIGAMSLDPTDATGNTLVVGVGRYSSLGRDGGTRSGALKSTDGGTTWTPINGTGAVTLAGKNISGMAIRGNEIIVAVNTADAFSNNNIGIFRSSDGGATYTQISGATGSGLPQGVTYDLVGDPVNNDVFYTGVAFGVGTGANGIYKSMDRGATWSKVSNATIDGLIGNVTSNFELAVGRNNNVFAAIINQGQLAGLFMSLNGGGAWTQLDSPVTNENGTNVGINPNPKGPGAGAPTEQIAGGQGSIHFSMAADPTNASLVYVAGDRQPNPFPNSIGARNFSGRIFRVDGSRAAGSQATSLTHNPSTASNSSPHADSRDMAFDALGDLLEGDDGGIYRRVNPAATGDWFGVHGNLQNTEFHSIAYDPLSNVYFGGTQDVGTPMQNASGTAAWSDFFQGDGGVVAVDAVSLAAQNRSIRYISFQNFGNFSRATFDSNNQLVSLVNPTLTVTQTSTSLSQADANIQFYQQYELNAIDPTRGIIGTRNIYESANRFDTLDRLFTGTSTITAMAYGGTGNADVIYYGDASGQLFVRQAAGGAFTQLANYQGGTPIDIVIDPDDWQTLIVIDSSGVYRSTDAGATWATLTGDLASENPGRLRTVSYIEGADDDGILVGGDRGVFLTELATIGMWDNFGPDLPNAPVRDLRYYAGDDVLVAGLMGRGAWVVSNASQEVRLDNDAPIIQAQSFNVNEMAPVGNSVGTVLATDPNVGQALSYSISSGNTGNAFAINSSTGELTVSNSAALDLLVNPVFTLTVTVQDNGIPSRSASAAVTVNVLEVNVAPVVPPQTFSIPENSPATTLVGTIAASDANLSQTKTFSIIAGNVGGAFAIDPATGALTVANPGVLNFEATPSFALTVSVLDNGLPPLSGTGTITVNLSNANDPPKVNPATLSVIEDAPVDTVVGTVTATDEDAGQTRTFSISSGNSGNAFKINPTTGVISVNNSAAIDWEVTPVFSLGVTAVDNGSPAASSTTTITINVTNINDPPRAVTFQNMAMSIAENVAKTTRVKVADIVVVDDGLGTNTLSLSGADASIFELDGTGLFVKSGTDLNFEVKSTYLVTVNADDVSLGTTPDASGNFTLKLVDVNEPPVLSGLVVRLVENSPVGTVVAANFATDPDAGQSLRYVIEAGNRNNAFAINATTGVITVNNPLALDYENEPPFELKVAAIDNGSPNLKSTGLIRVFLTDTNDAPSVYRAFKSIPENLPAGAVVLDYKVVAKDQDKTQTLTYAILAGNTNNAFAINPTTGVITVNNPQMLDYENQPPFELTIAVTDNGTPSLTSTAGLRITLTNENDAPSVYNATTNVFENAPVGSTVLDYKIVARDQDPGQSLTFAIVGGNRGDTFAINPATGLITVKNNSLLDFETGAPFDLTISTTDNGTPSRTSVANLRVNIKNVNEAPRITDASTTLFENSPAGTVVFDLKTTSTAPEPGQALKYQITAGNRQNAFAINPTTGVITVNNPAALDFETAAPFDLTVTVTDSVNAALTATGKLKVTLKDANDAPTIVNGDKTILENTAAGTVVFDVKTIARDTDVGQSLQYAITAGNTGNAFAINPATGVITVANAAAIDFETNPVFALKLSVTDNGVPAKSAIGTLTIRLTDLQEGPIVTPGTFSIPENSVAGTVVGTVVVSALPPGQTRTFAITGGNVNNAFSINAAGQIVVNNTAALNFEVKPSFTLSVAVTDTGTTATTTTAGMVVNVINVNEPPVIAAQEFAVKTVTAAGAVVGTVAASDPDAGQSRSFAIVSGNGIFNDVFRINATTGQITVNKALAVFFSKQFDLGIRVTDSGSPALSATGVVRIYVNATGTVPARSLPSSSAPTEAAGANVIAVSVSSQGSSTDGAASPLITKPKSSARSILSRLLPKKS